MEARENIVFPQTPLGELSTVQVQVTNSGNEDQVLSLIGVIRSILDDTGRTYEEVRDAVSTRLMELYRTQHSSAAFGLLYELNRQHLLQQVTGRLRRYQSRSDPQDVLQDRHIA